MRQRVIYEKVYRVSMASTGCVSDPEYRDADSPEEAGRIVAEFIARTPTWMHVNVRMVEVRIEEDE